MNKRIFLAATGIAMAALLFTPGCQLEVNDPVRNIPIVEPYISEHPKSASYNVQDSAFLATLWDALTVTVYGWVKADGDISYQWYRFDDIEDYCENGRGTLIPGATGARYYPPDLEATAGKVYYFYVVVKNDFETGTDRTSETVQSDIAIISFYNNSTASRPVITRHPSGATYIIGRTEQYMVSPLEVRATGNTVTYQWFSNATFSTEGGTEVDATLNATAETSSFVPDLTTLKRGDNFFYVEVTNTRIIDDDDRKATVTSLPVSIRMALGEKAAKPKITEQPKSQLIFATAAAASPITVKAVPIDAGELTYQWIRVDKPAPTGRLIGTTTKTVQTEPVEELEELAGKTEASFTPDIPPASPTPRVAYYYVRITNTMEVEPKEGETDAEREARGKAVEYSNIVTVNVATAAAPTATAFIQIPDDYNSKSTASGTRQQFIRGYGGMDVAWANFPNTTKEETELQYNRDWGLGYNILRIMIVPPGTLQRNYTNHKDIIYGRQRPAGADASWTNEGWNGLILGGQRKDYIENVKVVNRNGGYVLASPWTPPKEWKTNNSINSGGHLLPSNYQSYANYLRSFCQYMYYEGAAVYAVSIANEPNYSGGYDGCEWSPEQMRDFFIKVGQFTQGARGFGGGKSTPRVLIVNGESANKPSINNAALNDSRSRNAIDFYARHVYGEQLLTLWDNAYASWKEDSVYKTECWMTEHNINSANSIAFPNDYTWNYVWKFMNDIDLVIRRNNENAFVWWASKRFYSMIGDGQYNNTESAVLPRGYGLSHYAKYSNEFTRIDIDKYITGSITEQGKTATQISVGGEDGNVNANPPMPFNLDVTDAKITAYVSQDGSEISLVMYTPTHYSGDEGYSLGTIRIAMPDKFTIGSVQAVKSYRDHYMENYDVTVHSERKLAYVTLNRGEILSVKFTKDVNP
jgi:O-glycosyl hydrolase